MFFILDELLFICYRKEIICFQINEVISEEQKLKLRSLQVP